MDNILRAKIFAPFDALTGFREALRKKERLAVPKKELLEDKLEELDLTIKNIKPGDRVLVTYYGDGEYLSAADDIMAIDYRRRELALKGLSIDFDNICEIENIG